MTRQKKDSGLREAMCQRFVAAMNDLGMSVPEISRELGYSNATTIRKVQRGEAFVDVERLYRLSQLETSDGRHVDLHWLITGTEPRGKRWI